ncbi:MAG: DUF115 domain-containing protein [Treponema sp.]|nr:DUF115 domain-containing protein [Treponema sp.]
MTEPDGRPVGLPLRRAARRGYTVIYKNRTLLSTVDPITKAERTAAAVPLLDRTLYFCPSPLLGYGLDTLLSLISAGSAVLCLETDEKLFDLSQSSIDQSIFNDPRIVLSSIKDGTELCRFVRKTWGPRVFRRLETIRLSGGWQLDPGYDTMAELLRGDIAVDWGNAMTLIKLGRCFIRNVLRNLVMADQFITDMSFGSKPVLVLGAGPSLDPFLDNLQKTDLFQNKTERPFVLVCVDSCLAPLKERSIVPDLAVILESQYWNLRDFTGSRNAGIPAAVDLSAYPATVNILGGPVFFFFTPWTPLQFFRRIKESGLLPPVLLPLGSVGLCAVELARRLSSGPVICTGIDFSFSLDCLHARSSPARLSSLLAQNRFTSPFNTEAVFRAGVFNTFSKSKNPVKSDPAMQTYRNLFEQEFSGGRIMDIAGSGLSLGLETLTTEDAAVLLAGNTGRQQKPVQTTTENNNNELHDSGGGPDSRNGRLLNFIQKEKTALEELRAMLTGSREYSAGPQGIPEKALDEADYLWAHFPDCAGAEGRRPPASDLGFLKRVRAEIDPFIKLWELLEKENKRK